MLGAVLVPGAAARVLPALRPFAAGSPEELAADEDFWFPVQQAFAVDRSLINLNNGGVSPAPGPVMDALRRYDEYSNHAPARTMWRVLQPEYETVRTRLARLFGAHAEEVAITRNATESLDNLIFGLDLAPGDEVLTTDQDYPSMLQAWEQRAAREGLVLRKIAVPTPAPSQDALYDAFAAAMTERTRVILVSHVVNLTGQVFPVRRINELGRARGAAVIVDGAHSFAHFPFDRDSIDCDFFGTSLHKWLCAPIGSGLLYVRKERIPEVWPLFGQGEAGDIRKFEGIGTHPAGHRLAISEAVVFHEAIGAARKAARLRFLRDRWADRFDGDPRVRFHANRNDVDSGAIATVGIDGIEPGEIYQTLFREHRIVTSPIQHDSVKGVRVTPSIYTTVEEIDMFADAFADILANGA